MRSAFLTSLNTRRLPLDGFQLSRSPFRRVGQDGRDAGSDQLGGDAGSRDGRGRGEESGWAGVGTLGGWSGELDGVSPWRVLWGRRLMEVAQRKPESWSFGDNVRLQKPARTCAASEALVQRWRGIDGTMLRI